jgi:hypothetical protein
MSQTPDRYYVLTVFFVGAAGQQFLTKLHPSEVRARFRNPDQGWITVECYAPSEIKQPVMFEVLSIHVQGFAIGELVEQRVQKPSGPAIIGAH